MFSLERLMICLALPFRTKSAWCVGKMRSVSVSIPRYHRPLELSLMATWDGDGARREQAVRCWRTHLLHTVQVRVSDVPLVAVADLEAPGQLRLVQVGQQPNGQVTELDFFMVEAAAGDSEEG